MNYKTKTNFVMFLIVLLLLLLWLWSNQLKNKPDLLTVECGMQLDLNSYEVFGDKHINETIMQLVNPSKSEKFSHQVIGDNLNCLAHQELNSHGYFLSKTNAHNYILQAIHAHDDLFTGEILKLIMQTENAAQYASLSSVQREVLDSSVQQTLSNAVAEKLITSGKISAVIQIHGFAQNKRKTRKAKNANIILSSGQKESSLLANAIYQCLEARFNNVYLYGKNIYELGATENALLLKLQDKGYDDNFIHIELSLDQRKSLLNTSELKKFSQCFLQGKLNANSI